MRLVMIALIFLALLAAGGTAFMVKNHLTSQEEAMAKRAMVKVDEPEFYVLVADENIPVGTVLSEGAFRWQEWPEDNVGETFVSSAKKDDKLVKKFSGAVLRQAVAAGTPITQDMIFRRGEAGFLAGMIDDGMRAVTVAVDATSGAAGFILPGDRVDIILTFNAKELARGLSEGGGNRDNEEKSGPDPSGPAKFTSETVLRNIRVLAVDQNFKGIEEESSVAKTATLEATSKQVEILAVARAMGKISLALRSRAIEQTDKSPDSFTSDVEVSPTLRKIIDQIVKDSKKKKPRARRRNPDGAGRHRASVGAKVRVLRAGEETTREFPAR